MMNNTLLYLSAVSFIATFIAIKFSIPVLTRIAVAKVTDRSAHTGVVPQGAGLIIFTIVFLAVAGLKVYTGESMMMGWFIVQLCGLAVVLSVVGFIDDMKGLSIGVRLGVQILVAAISAYLLHHFAVFNATGSHIHYGFGKDTFGFSFIASFIVILVMINITNFMDGMDLMSVTQGVTFFGVLIWWDNLANMIFAPFLIAGLFAFAFYNKPKAKLFLGDSGSLPLGLLMGVLVAYPLNGFFSFSFIGMMILCSYYLADSGFTLLKRILRGERFWEGHKQHFYQKAMQNGQSVWSIVIRFFIFNCLTGATAFFVTWGDYISPSFSMGAIVFSIILLIILLWSFTRKFPLKTEPK